MIIGQVALSSALTAVRLGGSGWAPSNVPAATRRADVDVAILLRPAIEGAQCLAHFGLQLGYDPVRVERKVQRLIVLSRLASKRWAGHPLNMILGTMLARVISSHLYAYFILDCVMASPSSEISMNSTGVEVVTKLKRHAPHPTFF